MWKLWYYSTVKNVPVYWCSLTCIFLYKDRFCLLYDNIRVREKSIFLHILCSVDVEHLCKNEKKKIVGRNFCVLANDRQNPRELILRKISFGAIPGKEVLTINIYFSTPIKSYFFQNAIVVVLTACFLLTIKWCKSLERAIFVHPFIFSD